MSRAAAGQAAGQAGVSNPPSPMFNGELPTALGIKPEIGPPSSAVAGVMSVRLAPSSSTPTQRSGVMPCTWPVAEPAGSSATPLAIASTATSDLLLLHGPVPFPTPIDLLWLI
jgi:hypothetical protein